MQRYFENFSSVDDVISQFEAPPGAVKDEEILFAWYGYGSYSGDAEVLFQRDGKLYEVSGGHCSCYGLEGQWEPAEVAWEQLAMRKDGINPSGCYDDEGGKAKAAWHTLVNSHCPRA